MPISKFKVPSRTVKYPAMDGDVVLYIGEVNNAVESKLNEIIDYVNSLTVCKCCAGTGEVGDLSNTASAVCTICGGSGLTPVADKLGLQNAIEDDKMTWACRDHPAEGFHEVGCPHMTWTRKDLYEALVSAKKTIACHFEIFKKHPELLTYLQESRPKEDTNGK